MSLDQARFVNFSGPAGQSPPILKPCATLPCRLTSSCPTDELPRGDYGTTLLLGYALDPAMDVMVAYECNGEPLLPDHGFPLRLVIPGQYLAC